MEGLKVLEDWMAEKEENGLGMSALSGNRAYFLDYEEMRFYSPFDDELEDESEREVTYVQSKLCIGGLFFLEKEWNEGYRHYLAEKELLGS